LKAELVKQKLMLPDEKYDGLQVAYDKVCEANDAIFDIDVRRNPENFFSLMYQNGLMHGLEDVMASKKSGRFSDAHYWSRVKNSYRILQKRYSKKRNYKEVAYIEGFINGLLYFIFSDEDRLTLPLYFLFGCRPITTLQEYKELAKQAQYRHKSSYRFAEMMARDVRTEGVSFRHTPFL